MAVIPICLIIIASVLIVLLTACTIFSCWIYCKVFTIKHNQPNDDHSDLVIEQPVKDITPEVVSLV
uniref:P6 n=1 Tax=Heterorhabditis bacteriophora TaxID=37862 RepID=A0A1I7X4L6_HETBA